MGFRNVLISEESVLKIKLGSLIVLQVDKEEIQIPINDINSIVIDNLDTTLTTRLMEELAKNNVTVILCDKEHLPRGIYLGMNIHTRTTKVIKKQMALDEQIKGQLWQYIVKVKIRNQTMLIQENCNNNEETIKTLVNYYKEVELFDKTNREAHSAKAYFIKLFGKNFKRDDDDILINSALNYGYAIVRAHIARLCVAYGLNTNIGIFHKNEYNHFNLVDDLIEPFRPIVDKLAIEIMKDAKFFMSHHRKNLICIVDHKIMYKNKKVYLANALEEYVASYSGFLDSKNIKNIHIPKTLDFDLELEY